LSNINLFDAVEDGFSNNIKRIQELAKKDVTPNNCYAVLEELRSTCNPKEDSCDGPNHQTFQLSTEKVCSAVDSRTKLDVTATGNLFDFQNYAVPQPFTGTRESKYLRTELAVVCCKDDTGDIDDDDDKWYQNKDSCPFTSKSTKGMFLAYPSAEEFCDEEEGRLCTIAELERDCGDDWPQGELAWSSTESTDDIVCPAISSYICSEFVVELDNIYDTLVPGGYGLFPAGPRCPDGTGLTVDECREAGEELNIGQERDFKVGMWGHTPCGCFLWGANQLHYDKGTTCTTNTLNNNKGLVCKGNPMRVNPLQQVKSDFTNVHFPVDFHRVLSSSGREVIEGYEYYKHRKVFVTSNTYDGDLREDKSMNGYELLSDLKGPNCPDGLGLTSVAECEEARTELNLDDLYGATQVHGPLSRDWTPCGCFMWERAGTSGPLRFDDNRGKCPSNEPDVIGMICKKPVDDSGILGADMKCQTLANDAGLNGNYKAWISDRNNSPSCDFVDFNKDDDVPISFQLVDGTIIADSWDDLLDGSLQHPINMDENGVTVDSPLVWTSTYSDGTANSPDYRYCETKDPDRPTYTQTTGWASTLDTTGHTGDSSSVTSSWSRRNFFSCSAERRLYCFQQTPVSIVY